VIVPARVAILCPEGCNCDKGGHLVSCSGASLNPLPLIHLTDIRILRLDENNITLLEKDSFVSLTELEDLYIEKCGLKMIELGAFNGLTELTVLIIKGNGISEILTGTFENMNSLEYLSL
jgi:Leucine-rich repeat (LRR) protein